MIARSRQMLGRRLLQFRLQRRVTDAKMLVQVFRWPTYRRSLADGEESL
jgi:hypothetical protein